MRLVCPNCSAQYEIDGSMIPEEGRDVQCSNCGHTWFELPAPSATPVATTAFASEPEVEDEFDSPPAYDLDDDRFEEEDDDILPTTRPKSVPDFISREDFEDDGDRATSIFSDWEDEDEEPDAAPEDGEEDTDAASAAVRAITEAAEADDAEETSTEELDDKAEASGGSEDEDESAAGAALAVAAKPRRPADAAALDILREEAERELSQRRAPPSEPLETQADLGLDDIRNRRTPSRALRARMAHLGEEMPEPEKKAPARTISEPPPAPRTKPESADHYEERRRDLLPDIDEINSTLKGRTRKSEDQEAVQRSGFRYGFLLVVFLTIAAIFAYAQAPAIARALPQTEATMISYVDWANGLRDWVDSLISN